MIRRAIRLGFRAARFGFRAALLAGVCVALFKLVQSRRAAQELPPSSDWLPPRRPEKPLVEPEMLQGLALKKQREAVVEPELDAEPPDDEPAGGDDGDSADAAPWVEPDGSACPASHPIKGKLSSGIFHLPGMLAYERTRPDRCYVDESSAEADGLRKAKR